MWQGSCSFAGCEEQVPVSRRVENDASVIANGLTKRLHARAGRELGEELGGLQPADETAGSSKLPESRGSFVWMRISRAGEALDSHELAAVRH